MKLALSSAGANDMPVGTSNANTADTIRFGIRAKLQIAFGVVAAMTVIATGVAIVSFSATERGFQYVADHEVPVMTDALRLSAVSGEISAAAARSVSAKTAADQRAIVAIIANRHVELTNIIERLRASRGSNPAFAAVENTAQKLEENLKALERAVSERTELGAKLETRLAELHKTHAQISEKLTPVVDDSYFEVISAAEDVGKSSGKVIKSLINDGLRLLQAAVEMRAETNLATGLLTAGALTSSPPMLALLEDRFTASAQRAQRLLKSLPDDAESSPLKTQILSLLKLADFSGRTDAGNASERLNRVFRAHESLAGLSIKLVDDLNFNLVIQGEDAVKKSDKVVKALVANQITGLRNALETAAQTHLITSLISEGAVARDANSLVPIQDRFKASSNLLVKVTSKLGEAEIKNAVGKLIAFGNVADNVFAMRAHELQADRVADAAVAENVTIQQSLDKAVATLVAEAEGSMKNSAAQLMGELGHNRMMLIVVAGISVLIAACIGIFYVQPRLVRRLTTLGEIMRRVSHGETDVAVPAFKDRDEIGQMAKAVLVFRDAAAERRRLEAEAEEQRRLGQEERARHAQAQAKVVEERAAEQAKIAAEQARVVELLAEGLNKLVGGDLTFRLSGDVTAAYVQIKDDFNSAFAQLQDTIKAIAMAAHEVIDAASEISASTTDLSQRTEEQAASLEETTASMEEISAMVKQNAKNAQVANQITIGTSNVADRGSAVVANAIASMSQIEESSHKIADIISVIDEIARQTNLLALNAAVEAARAGEAGRGFAVVATEVRSLAQRSSQAAKDIKSLITNSNDQIKGGVALVDQVGESLNEIVASIKKAADIVADIATASSEQATGLEQINKALNQMDGATQQNSALVEENAATAKALETQAAAMTERVKFFHIESSQGRTVQLSPKPAIISRAPAFHAAKAG
jgi:methyl-accepting chemotaxis protein